VLQAQFEAWSSGISSRTQLSRLGLDVLTSPASTVSEHALAALPDCGSGLAQYTRRARAYIRMLAPPHTLVQISCSIQAQSSLFTDPLLACTWTSAVTTWTVTIQGVVTLHSNKGGLQGIWCYEPPLELESA
jgi:hypothetical protein